MARAKFIEAFASPIDILAPGPTFGVSNTDQVIENMHEPIVQHPVDSFSFGWLDGMSISQDSSKPDSFFILFRQPNEDPWSTHTPTLALYRLEANFTAGVGEEMPPSLDAADPTSHLFSETFLTSTPLDASTSPTSTSSSASTKLVLGHHRTALWLSPRPRESDSTGLVQMDLNRQEDWPSQSRGIRSWRYHLGDDLVWASFSPRRTRAETQGGDNGNCTGTADDDPKMHVFTRRVCNSHGEVLTAIGYDEETGRVALGRRDGCITFLRL